MHNLTMEKREMRVKEEGCEKSLNSRISLTKEN